MSYTWFLRLIFAETQDFQLRPQVFGVTVVTGNATGATFLVREDNTIGVKTVLLAQHSEHRRLVGSLSRSTGGSQVRTGDDTRFPKRN